MVTSRPLSLTTADDIVLDGDWSGPEDPGLVVIATHPHPLYGGTHDHPVLAALAREVPATEPRIAVLRFDFRGVGHSGGAHGEGAAELGDIEAAITAVDPATAVVLAGYSFGADVSLQVTHPKVVGWVAIAPPLALVAPDRFGAGPDLRPVLVASPAHDQFCPPAVAAERTTGWTSTELVTIESADHFLLGATARVVDLVAGFCAEVAGWPEVSRRPGRSAPHTNARG